MTIATTTIEYLTAWATLGTAVATLTLAAGTFYMALKTRDEARATRDDVDASKAQIDVALQQVELSRRQADAAELAVTAQNRPILIDVPNGVEREALAFDGQGNPTTFRDASEVIVRIASDTNLIQIAVPLRNIGTGLARVTGLSFSPGFPAVWTATIAKPNIPPRERARFVVSVGPDQAGHPAVRELIERRGTFSVAVTYTDAGGGQPTVTRADLQPSGTERWRVQQIFTGPAGDANALVGSAAMQD